MITPALPTSQPNREEQDTGRIRGRHWLSSKTCDLCAAKRSAQLSLRTTGPVAHLYRGSGQRFGRNIFEVIKIINQLSENGVGVILLGSQNYQRLGRTGNCCKRFTVILRKRNGNLFQCEPNKV